MFTLYIYIFIYKYIYIYIYTCRYTSLSIPLSLSLYIYIYTLNPHIRSSTTTGCRRSCERALRGGRFRVNYRQAKRIFWAARWIVEMQVVEKIVSPPYEIWLPAFGASESAPARGLGQLLVAKRMFWAACELSREDGAVSGVRPMPARRCSTWRCAVLCFAVRILYHDYDCYIVMIAHVPYARYNVYLYMRVCMHMYVCVYICTYIYIYICM